MNEATVGLLAQASGVCAGFGMKIFGMVVRCPGCHWLPRRTTNRCAGAGTGETRLRREGSVRGAATVAADGVLGCRKVWPHGGWYVEGR